MLELILTEVHSGLTIELITLGNMIYYQKTTTLKPSIWNLEYSMIYEWNNK